MQKNMIINLKNNKNKIIGALLYIFFLVIVCINFYTKYLRAEVNKSSLPLHYLTVILHYVIMLKSQIKQ